MSNENLIATFTSEEIKQIIYFCKNYHLDESKRLNDRTNSGRRGFGGVVDAFGPGKLTEIGICKILANLTQDKELFPDTEVYSDSEVGKKVNPDIISVKENNQIRKPKLYIEIKDDDSKSDWIGIREDQLNSIKRVHGDDLEKVFLIFGRTYFDDNKNEKEKDFFGSFLKSINLSNEFSFNEFSDITNIKCDIKYAFSVADLITYGHLYKAGEIIMNSYFDEAKQIYTKKGSLWKDKILSKELKDNEIIIALTEDGQILPYSEFNFVGYAHLIINKDDNNKKFIHFLKDSTIENKYFGRFDYKKGTSIFFNIKNKLGTKTEEDKDKNKIKKNKTKNINDWWLSKHLLEQLFFEGKINKTDVTLKYISTNI
jgi:hypothetical protein